MPLDLTVRFFAKADLTPDQSWHLLTWCLEHGADQFTIEGMVAGQEGARNAAFFDALQPYELAEAPRRRLSAASASDFVRPTSLWALNLDTITLLRGVMEDGIFDYNAGGDPWLEDLAVYRQGEFMMGVVTHEDGGVLRVTADELIDLDRIGFPHRDEVPWVGY